MIANNMRILGEMDLAEFRQTMDRIDNARPEIPQPAPEQDNRPPPSPGRVGFGPMI